MDNITGSSSNGLSHVLNEVQYKNILITGKLGPGRELKGLWKWATEFGLQLPADYEPDPVLFDAHEACAILEDLGVLPERIELNPVQLAALAMFPVVEKAFFEKLQEGYKLLTFRYEYKRHTGHESLDIVFSKDYERFLLTQGKGCYAGGYSFATFGREGERGEVL